MRITFDYPGYEAIAPCEVPDANLMGVYAPKSVEVDERRVLEAGMSSPIGARPLAEHLAPHDRVLILVDDGTRKTRISDLLPFVLEQIGRARVPLENVDILTAQGTHRPMTEAELKDKLGGWFGRVRVAQHDWRDERSLADFGFTKDGTRVTANRLLREANFVIGLGSIVPHRVKGFSGGAKIAFPGVAGREIMERNQWEASMHMSKTVMGEAENPMRLRMEEAGRLAGLRYIVNLVSDVRGRIAGCFAGDPVAAHRRGAALSRDIHRAELSRRADIAIIDAHPADRDFWQSAKAAYAGAIAVREGGTIIMVAPNPEGVADNHPNLLENGYRPHAEIVTMVQKGLVEDLVGAAILADVAQIVDHAECIMVSPGVDAASAERLGFRYASTVAGALDAAFVRHGRRARVAVLKHGGHILPSVPAG